MVFTNYDDAETFVLQSLEGKLFPYRDDRFYIESMAQDIIGLAKDSTLNELLLKSNQDDPFLKTASDIFDNPCEEAEAALASIVLSEYQNLEEKIQRADNWLNPNATIIDTEDWQTGYRNAVANFLIKEGSPARFSLSYYGWQAYEKQTSPVVAAFHIVQQDIEEFQGTFVDSDTSTVVTGELLHANGETTYQRWNGSLGEILQAITR